MKVFLKTIFILISFCIVFNITACSNRKEKSAEVVNLPNYDEVSVIEGKNGEVDTFKIENRELYKIASVENLLSMVYSIKNKVYVNSIKVSKGDNSNYNKLQMITKEKKLEIQDFYAAIDLKLNSAADKIAFRTYKSSSLDSAQGMKVYDIKNNQYVNLKSNVLVSGNLYEWIDKNKIIYYGTINGQKNSDKIYEYDFNSSNESVYLQNIDGYCMYLVPIKENLLFLTKQGDISTLCYYNKESNSVKNIKNDISNLYNSVVNYKSGDVYFLAGQNEGETALYRFSSKNLKVDRITYDFPKKVDESAGIAMDKDGNVYFCGLENPDEKYKKDIFMYDIKEKSTNLIAAHQGNYSLYYDNSNF